MGVLWSYQHSTTDVLGTSYPALRHRKVSETGSILAIYESSKVICFLALIIYMWLNVFSFHWPLLWSSFPFPHLSVISSSVWGQSNAVLFKKKTRVSFLWYQSWPVNSHFYGICKYSNIFLMPIFGILLVTVILQLPYRDCASYVKKLKKL